MSSGIGMTLVALGLPQQECYPSLAVFSHGLPKRTPLVVEPTCVAPHILHNSLGTSSLHMWRLSIEPSEKKTFSQRIL